MKTPTKLQILEIIRKNKSARPKELVKFLKITPQAVHRHLKALVSAGIIEKKGHNPFTRYTIAGAPDFTNALIWFQSNSPLDKIFEVSETRDIFAARLSRFYPLVEQNRLKDDPSLVISITGEVGNNSFDHNLGQWKDVPGCWFEIQATHNRLWILIADRGQGIYSSISQVAPEIKDDQEAVEIAFNKTISGRTPEKRGNGLKYVKNVVTSSPSRGVACRSGGGLIDFGDLGKDCSNILRNISDNNIGTITLIAWMLNEDRN